MGAATLRQLLGRKTLIMGVVNVTPDSFYDGGQHAAHEAAVAHGRALLSDGADIVDIGGESSRPGSDPVAPDEETARVLPVFEALSAALPDATLSVDTYHAETARAAVDAGAGIVNDITALRGDPAMADVVASSRCICVLMHMLGSPKTMQDAPRYNDVVDDLLAFFDDRISYAVSRGIREDRLWIDPGFGFGKTVAHNLDILRRLGAFRSLGLPILIGTSNKSTIGTVLDAPVDDRMEGTAATVAIAIAHGADAVRVHDVKTMARVARMSDAIIKRGRP